VLLYPPLSLHMEPKRTRRFSSFTTLCHYGADPSEISGITFVNMLFFYTLTYTPTLIRAFCCALHRFTIVYSGRFLWEGRGALGETLILWQGICFGVGEEEGSMLCTVKGHAPAWWMGGSDGGLLR